MRHADRLDAFPQTVLMQWAVGEHYEDMLWLSASRLEWLHSTTIVRRFGKPDVWARPIMWLKIRYLRDLADKWPDGSVLWYADADVLWTRPFDPSCALPGNVDFAAVVNCSGLFNCGCMWFRNSQRVRDCLRVIDIEGPSLDCANDDQRTINRYVRSRLKCLALPSEFNAYNGAACRPTEPPLIIAWHGLTASMSLEGMRRAIEAPKA
jgi:hypothetical protein